MANTLEFMNVGGTMVGVRWSYEVPIMGVTSDDGAVIGIFDEPNPDTPTASYPLGETLGFDEIKQVDVSPTEFDAGSPVALYAWPESGLVFLAGPVSWPEIVPDVDPPPVATYSPWIQTSNTLPIPDDAPGGFSVNSDDDFINVQFNRYADAIEYDLMFHEATASTWLALATLPQTEPEVQTWAYPWPDDVRFSAGQNYIYRLRARLT